MLAGTIIGITQITRIVARIDSMASDFYPKTVMASGIRNALNDTARSMRGVLFATTADEIAAELASIDKAGKTMDEIVTSVMHVTDIVREISTASREQSTGLEEINRAIARMDEMTQQNAALVEQAAAAAESMQAQAVEVFKLQQPDASRNSGVDIDIDVVPAANDNVHPLPVNLKRQPALWNMPEPARVRPVPRRATAVADRSMSVPPGAEFKYRT